MKHEAFKRLEQAASESGFIEVAFLAEPTAAVIGEPAHQSVEVAVDFGGGTFDVAVLDSRGDSPRIAGTEGIAIGGEMLDGVLFETIVGPALGLDTLGLHVSVQRTAFESMTSGPSWPSSQPRSDRRCKGLGFRPPTSTAFCSRAGRLTFQISATI